MVYEASFWNENYNNYDEKLYIGFTEMSWQKENTTINSETREIAPAILHCHISANERSSSQIFLSISLSFSPCLSLTLSLSLSLSPSSSPSLSLSLFLLSLLPLALFLPFSLFPPLSSIFLFFPLFLSLCFPLFLSLSLSLSVSGYRYLYY